MKRLLFLLLMVLLLGNTAEGALITIDFENVPLSKMGPLEGGDNNLRTWYDGLYFREHVVVYDMEVHNDFNWPVYPPNSGTGVAVSREGVNDWPPVYSTIQIDMWDAPDPGDPTNHVDLYYSWGKISPDLNQITLTALDQYGNILVETTDTTENYVGSSEGPNAHWVVDREDYDIYSVTITGPIMKFVIDDFTYEDPASAHGPGAVPIPPSAWLLGIGLVGLAALRRQSKT